MIDHSRKLLFIHIARTGGTSIESALVGEDWWGIESSTKHISASQAREIYGEEIWRTYAKFAIVRNPWDRIVSMWATKWWHRSSNLEEGCPLEFFIKNLKPHPHEIYNSLFYTQILDEKIDFVLRFERLQSDFNSMLNSLGFESTPLPHTEKRDHAPYAKAYTKVSKILVSDMFSKDISYFDYEF